VNSKKTVLICFSANVGRQCCPGFQEFCLDIQRFCPDFWQIKTFGGALALHLHHCYRHTFPVVIITLHIRKYVIFLDLAWL